nr:VCBS repeat-containing protein [Ardenticatenales bacterium]
MAKAKIISAIRILTASSITVFLMLLALSSLFAANTTALAAHQPEQQNQGQGSDLAQAGQATPTPVVTEEPPLSSDSILEMPRIVDRTPAPPLPSWILEQGAWYDSSSVNSGLAVSKTVETGQQANDFVYNGDYITYTITLHNVGTTGVRDIHLEDILPPDKLEDIECLFDAECTPITESVTIKDPLGVDTVVTVIRRLSWSIDTIAPQTTISRSFRARVTGQADNSSFDNRAYVFYYLTGENTGRVTNSEPVSTIVRVRVAQVGQASVSTAPTWFSSDLGGTLSQDWGDFDQDGDLDLVLATSSGGTILYKNNSSSLEQYWRNEVLTIDNERLSYGVRWADFDNDGDLELVTVGSSKDGTAATAGMTYIYRYNPAATTKKERFIQLDTFDSDYQMVRVEPGDFNGDGSIDLVVSTNSINATCPVRLHLNSADVADIFADTYQCVSKEASANMKPADYDNDGDLDLVLGLFEAQNVVLVRNAGVDSSNPLSTTLGSFVVDSSMLFLPYDFAWGDYNKDGYLDLAAGYPLQREVRVYQNIADGGRAFSDAMEFRTTLFRTPLALDWGDFDGDGSLELAVADSPPQIREFGKNPNTGRDEFLATSIVIPDAVVKSGHQLWSLRAIDYDNDGDMDLSITDRDGPSMMLTGFVPALSTKAQTVGAKGQSSASSVAWGDADSDGDYDLLFGAASVEQGAFGSTLYYNEEGKFSNDNNDEYSGFGPHSVAFGNVDSDSAGDLDVAIGTIAQAQVYQGGEFFDSWTSEDSFETRSVAWGDADDDGFLDLLLGNNGSVVLYLNQKLATPPSLLTTPSWSDFHQKSTRSVAWGDFNLDGYLDFAMGNTATTSNRVAVEVYLNNQNATFTQVWSYSGVASESPIDARSVAWGDYDGDGDLDLAVGTYNNANLIFENYNSATTPPAIEVSLSASPVWASSERYPTTSLAWGDWDNDGDLDLAVGNYTAQTTARIFNQVYANLGSKPGSPRLEWVWTAAQAQRTSGIAWGDIDGDGDLDLAYSQDSKEAQSGYYLNSYVSPSHHEALYASTMPYANNPSYVTLGRPGSTDRAYFYSSPEILSGHTDPIITITYKVYDPDGSRSSAVADAMGDNLVTTFYEYSLDGGGMWETASPALSSGQPLTETSRLGQEGVFLWDAQEDAAISDNARFRIRVVHE